MNHYTYSQLQVGDLEEFEVKVTPSMVDNFLQITSDNNPLHMDEDFAREKGYEGKVVYGMLTASFLSTLAGVYLPGERSLIHRVEVEFPRPVYVSDVLKVHGEVKEKNDAFQYIVLKVTITNQFGDKVLRGKMRIQLLDK